METGSREVTEAVREAAREGKLTCEQAHRLAADLHIPLIELGKAADALSIKICNCQLGCF